MLMAMFTTACSNTAPSGKTTGSTMGTTYSVLVADCEQAECARLDSLVATRLDELSKRLSHWDPESELSAFNQSTPTDWVAISADLSTVVAYALEISDRSNGAFDITVASAVNTWGFGPAEPTAVFPTQPPTRNAIDTARQNSGYEKLGFRPTPPAIRKTSPHVQLDLSALAKGYAVDQLAYLLEELGSDNYLVEIGGEIRIAGARAAGTPWRIGIEQPESDNLLDIKLVVTPGEAAIATSGDYRNFYTLGERRISHTIDPATAQPVRHNLSAVSVIAPDTMQADALATALLVMGPVAGPEFARRDNIAALFFVRSETETRAIPSPAFEVYLPTSLPE
jgi:thiamine biosynthesis lipoprotein